MAPSRYDELFVSEVMLVNPIMKLLFNGMGGIPPPIYGTFRDGLSYLLLDSPTWVIID